MSLGIMFYKVSMLPADLAGNPPEIKLNYQTKNGVYNKTYKPISIKEIAGFLKDAYAVQRFFVPDERDTPIDIIDPKMFADLKNRCEFVLEHVGKDNFLSVVKEVLPDNNLIKMNVQQADIDWYIEYLKKTIEVIQNLPELEPNQSYRYMYWY